MKYVLTFLLNLALSVTAYTQVAANVSLEMDSLQSALNLAKGDSVKVDILIEMSRQSDDSTSLEYAMRAKALANKIGYLKGEALALKTIGLKYFLQSNYVFAFDYWDRALVVYESLHDLSGISNILNNDGSLFFQFGNNQRAREFFERSYAAAKNANDSSRMNLAMMNLGLTFMDSLKNYSIAVDYLNHVLQVSQKLGDQSSMVLACINLSELKFNQNDETAALYYLQRAQKLSGYPERLDETLPYLYEVAARYYFKKGKNAVAINYYESALEMHRKFNSSSAAINSLLGLAEIYLKSGDQAKALKLFKKSEVIALENKLFAQQNTVYKNLIDIYSKRKKYADVIKYQKLKDIISDTLMNITIRKSLDSVRFNSILEGKEQQQKLIAQKKQHESELLGIRYRNNLKFYSLLIGLGAVLILAVILFRNNQHRKRTNSLLVQQKIEIENALANLKNAQKQLVQSEKMASLGELTAGIAHEIQNPMNFVNNFSEVNTELIDELIQEMEKGNSDEVKYLAADIKHNQVKISQHGKRVDAIVKSMLEHSRASSGQKEPTDLNKLLEEYLRLAFHGQRAKDRSFHVTLHTDYDDSIGMINIISQDIGRVLLNLVNNAFYTVNERAQQQAVGYEPTVSIISRKLSNKVEIIVKDNGMGFSEKIRDKLFQPFFTTKPTGQGTGLGLSLSYDIIKAHNGDLLVDSKEGEGSAFTILLPY